MKKCANHNGFEQLDIFGIPYEPKHEPERKPAPRKSWAEYGLEGKERRKELKAMAQVPEYAKIVRICAHIAAPEIEAYIYMSVTKNITYEGLQRLWELNEIERMACGRTDFYGYRRYFYYIFSKEVRK